MQTRSRQASRRRKLAPEASVTHHGSSISRPSHSTKGDDSRRHEGSRRGSGNQRLPTRKASSKRSNQSEIVISSDSEEIDQDAPITIKRRKQTPKKPPTKRQRIESSSSDDGHPMPATPTRSAPATTAYRQSPIARKTASPTAGSSPIMPSRLVYTPAPSAKKRAVTGKFMSTPGSANKFRVLSPPWQAPALSNPVPEEPPASPLPSALGSPTPPTPIVVEVPTNRKGPRTPVIISSAEEEDANAEINDLIANARPVSDRSPAATPSRRRKEQKKRKVVKASSSAKPTKRQTPARSDTINNPPPSSRRKISTPRKAAEGVSSVLSFHLHTPFARKKPDVPTRKSPYSITANRDADSVITVPDQAILPENPRMPFSFSMTQDDDEFSRLQPAITEAITRTFNAHKRLKRDPHGWDDHKRFWPLQERSDQTPIRSRSKIANYTLMSTHERLFPQWAFEVVAGFDLLFYGWGSKISLMEKFSEYLRLRLLNRAAAYTPDELRAEETPEQLIEPKMEPANPESEYESAQEEAEQEHMISINGKTSTSFGYGISQLRSTTNGRRPFPEPSANDDTRAQEKNSELPEKGRVRRESVTEKREGGSDGDVEVKQESDEDIEASHYNVGRSNAHSTSLFETSREVAKTKGSPKANSSAGHSNGTAEEVTQVKVSPTEYASTERGDIEMNVSRTRSPEASSGEEVVPIGSPNSPLCSLRTPTSKAMIERAKATFMEERFTSELRARTYGNKYVEKTEDIRESGPPSVSPAGSPARMIVDQVHQHASAEFIKRRTVQGVSEEPTKGPAEPPGPSLSTEALTPPPIREAAPSAIIEPIIVGTPGPSEAVSEDAVSDASTESVISVDSPTEPESEVITFPVKGYDMKLSISGILNDVMDQFGIECTSKKLMAKVDAIKNALSLRASSLRLMLVVHCIDGPGLRNPSWSYFFRNICELTNVITVASMDHVKGGLMETVALKAGRPWVRHDLTTYMPYELEAEEGLPPKIFTSSAPGKTRRFTEEDKSNAVSSVDSCITVLNFGSHGHRGIWKILSNLQMAFLKEARAERWLALEQDRKNKAPESKKAEALTNRLDNVIGNFLEEDTLNVAMPNGNLGSSDDIFGPSSDHAGQMYHPMLTSDLTSRPPSSSGFSDRASTKSPAETPSSPPQPREKSESPVVDTPSTPSARRAIPDEVDQTASIARPSPARTLQKLRTPLKQTPIKSARKSWTKRLRSRGSSAASLAVLSSPKRSIIRHSSGRKRKRTSAVSVAALASPARSIGRRISGHKKQLSSTKPKASPASATGFHVTNEYGQSTIQSIQWDGISLADLYAECRRCFIVSYEGDVKQALQLFVEHHMLEKLKRPGMASKVAEQDRWMYRIPMSDEDISKVLAKLA